MRRVVVSSLLAIALIVTGCSSGSTTTRTVTKINTVTSSAATPTTPGSGSVIVVSPTVSPTSTVPPTTVAKTTATPTPTTTKPTVAPIVKVNPLAADCTSVLDAADIKKALAFTIATGTVRKKDVANPARGITGKIRCYYPKADAKGTAPVVVALTQYSTAAAAAKQVDVTVQAETDAGAVVSATAVNGYPAHVLLRAGGLIVVQYGTWTAAVAIADKLANSSVLGQGLPILAGQVLTRVIKNG